MKNVIKVRRDKLMELMNTYFYGSYKHFAIELGLDPGHLHHYINKGIRGGPKLTEAVKKFCQEKELD